MLKMHIKLEGLPNTAEQGAYNMQRFRDIVGHRMRRRLDLLNSEAKEKTSDFPRFQDNFVVQQKSEGNTLTFTWANTHERYRFFENDTRGGDRAMPPWGPGSELADWAMRHDLPPYLVARTIKARGTRGKRVMSSLWQENFDDIDSVARGAVSDFMHGWFHGRGVSE